MTGGGEAHAAALLIAGAFMFAFGMFTVAFSFAMSSPAAGVTGAALITVAVGTVHRESRYEVDQLTEKGAA